MSATNLLKATLTVIVTMFIIGADPNLGKLVNDSFSIQFPTPSNTVEEALWSCNHLLWLLSRNLDAISRVLIGVGRSIPTELSILIFIVGFAIIVSTIFTLGRFHYSREQLRKHVCGKLSAARQRFDCRQARLHVIQGLASEYIHTLGGEGTRLIYCARQLVMEASSALVELEELVLCGDLRSLRAAQSYFEGFGDAAWEHELDGIIGKVSSMIADSASDAIRHGFMRGRAEKTMQQIASFAKAKMAFA